MNIVIASHDLHPDPGSGGTGRYVAEVGRELADRGHTISVITRRRGDRPSRETLEGLDVYRYDIRIAEQTALDILPQLPRVYRTISSHLDRLAPDLVSFQGPVTSLFVHRLLDRTIPRSCTFHSPWPAEYRLRTRGRGMTSVRRHLNVGLREYLERVVVSSADELITLSKFMRDQLRVQYSTNAEMAVIPGGVDPDRFSPNAGVNARVSSVSPSFLTVRRLSPRMGHDLLFKAFKRVKEGHPTAELFVAGDGPLRDRLAERADSLGIDEHITFLGFVPDDELPGLYASADVFVLPTTELEGFGLSTLEALASGTPVVGTPVGGTVGLLGDVESHVDVPERMLLVGVSIDELAERMLAWADVSSQRCLEAGEACSRYVSRRYSWAKTVDALEQRYRALQPHRIHANQTGM